ncbi:DA1 isoform X1 [Chlorella sorokiniana]|uniref:DA1 isoform X1 n=1 Tax=Chlorella sorokiniana TaxID=3076 RepID=A0A2P6TTF1_CHLSO|nr:DA1 isoform X1 [Chlorella sorokiniana]|eukprot:PRW57350.1 DA1 isoform X1 [Chlorella sorokiniana]
MGWVYGTDKMWGDKCCPGHWSDGAQRCISCRRFIPRNERFLVLDAGRKACCRCFETLVVTHQDAQPVYQNVRRFFASQGMQLRQPPPVYVLDSSNMAGRSGDALRRCGVWSGVAAGLFQPVGVPTIRTVQYVQQTPHGPRVVYQHQQLGPQVVQARAIFLRYGMSRLQAGSVLAHEHMHACLQVGTRADQPLPIWMEEGMCQLAAYLYLEDLLDRGSLSQPGRTLCKVLMEGLRDETNPVYGGGFRAAHRAWTGMQWRGLSHMVAYMRQHGRFPT